MSPLLYKPQKNGPVKHCSTKQRWSLVHLSASAFCHRPPHQHGQSGHFVCLLLFCPWHCAGHLKAHVRTIFSAEGAQPRSILGHRAAPLCLPRLFTSQKEEQSMVQTWQDLATLSTDDSSWFPSRRSREVCSLTVLPTRCPEQSWPGWSSTRGLSKPLHHTSGLPEAQHSAPQTCASQALLPNPPLH